MKKILLLSAVLLGAVSASQAGVHLNFGLRLPLPPLPLPGVVIGHPSVAVMAPAPVYADPYAYGYGAPVYAAPPVVVAPPSVYLGIGPGYYGGYGHYYHGYPHYYGHGYSHGGYGHGGYGHSGHGY